MATQRIAKAIAQAGVCSRRDAEAMIMAGRVSVNGATITSPALNVTEIDEICVDGKPVLGGDRTRLFRYHKPRGTICEPVMEPESLPRMFAIGQLIKLAEGLQLFATDTQTASEVASEMAEWPSQFRIRVNGPVPDSRLSELPKNYPLVIQATCDSRNGANAWVTLKLAKGDPADALEICDALGLTVSRMIRTSLGDISLGDLVPGAFAPAV